jgi:hypothetical protein
MLVMSRSFCNMPANMTIEIHLKGVNFDTVMSLHWVISLYY